MIYIDTWYVDLDNLLEKYKYTQPMTTNEMSPHLPQNIKNMKQKIQLKWDTDQICC